MSSSELAPSTSPGISLESLSQTAGDALRRALASSATGAVLSKQVEEDLRSALAGLEALHALLVSANPKARSLPAGGRTQQCRRRGRLTDDLDEIG